jgi:hypothetical protein
MTRSTCSVRSSPRSNGHNVQRWPSSFSASASTCTARSARRSGSECSWARSSCPSTRSHRPAARQVPGHSLSRATRVVERTTSPPRRRRSTAATTPACWVVRAVAQNTCRSVRRARRRAPTRTASVFPRPVGASTSTGWPASKPHSTASAISRCPGRHAACGSGTSPCRRVAIQAIRRSRAAHRRSRRMRTARSVSSCARPRPSTWRAPSTSDTSTNRPTGSGWSRSASIHR